MAIRRVSDLQNVTIGDISGVDVSKNKFQKSRIEISENQNAEDEPASRFMSKAYDIDALAQIINSSPVFSDEKTWNNINKFPSDDGTKLVKLGKGNLELADGKISGRGEVQLDRTAVKINENDCSDDSNIAITGKTLSLKSYGNTVLSSMQNVTILGYTGVNISVANTPSGGKIQILNSHDITLSSGDTLNLIGKKILINADDISVIYGNSFVVYNADEQGIISAYGISVDFPATSKTTPINGYINHALWS